VTTAIERIPTTFNLLKMVANPTPMPFTTVWHSATELARTLRLTAFLGLAQQEVIKCALADSLLFPSADAEKAARLLISMRSTMVKRGSKGLLGGFAGGFIPGLVIRIRLRSVQGAHEGSRQVRTRSRSR
jgi:hypothetical protein